MVRSLTGVSQSEFLLTLRCCQKVWVVGNRRVTIEVRSFSGTRSVPFRSLSTVSHYGRIEPESRHWSPVTRKLKQFRNF